MITQNLITLLGNVGAAPEVVQFPDGGKKAVVSLATNSGSGDKVRTQWHKVIFFNKAADAIETLQAGDALFVQGSLDYRKWQDKDGNPRISPEILVDAFTVINRKADDAQSQHSHNNGYHQEKTQPRADAPAQAPAPAQAKTRTTSYYSNSYTIR